MEIQISKAPKYETNPFILEDVFKMNTATKTVIVGSQKKVLVDTDTGEVEGYTLLHKFKEVDKEQFVKLYVNEIQSLFDLSKTGLRVFSYIISLMRINDATIYLDIHTAQKECGYAHKKAIYKGLSELVQNKIVALSNKPNLWFINPNIVFNGDRIAFIKEYKMKKKAPIEEGQILLSI